MGLTGAFASIITGGIGLAGANNQANAIRSQGQYDQGIVDQNISSLDKQAADALSRGDLAAHRYYNGLKQTLGTQRSAFASNGVDPNSGSALDVQNSSEKIGDSDIVTIKANAFRESLGYTQEADQWRRRKGLMKSATDTAANNTILSGGLQFLEGAGKGISSIASY